MSAHVRFLSDERHLRMWPCPTCGTFIGQGYEGALPPKRATYACGHSGPERCPICADATTAYAASQRVRCPECRDGLTLDRVS